MLWRNRRSYAMLSVTIVLSFSLLLGYLVFVDSQLYNKYKVILSAERDIVMAYSWETNPAAHNDLEKMAHNTDASVQLYQYFTHDTTLKQYGNVNARVTFLPNGNVPVYQLRTVLLDEFGNSFNYATKTETIMGQSGFGLEADQAIVNESLFYAISPDGLLPVSISIPTQWADGKETYYKLEVVGVVRDHGDCSLSLNENGTQTGQTYIYVSQSLLGEHTAAELPVIRRITWMSTQYPNEMAEYARSLNMVVHSISKTQDTAIESIGAQKQTKGMVAVVLLLLLGINLYSSFSNALNDRKYEIGVKRAIGASSWDIMGQFFVESILVMLMNILLSVVLVTDVLAVYKLWWQSTHSISWIVDVSVYSPLMFAVCSFSLTVVFSMLFAYKSTKVEIIQYLKAE